MPALLRTILETAVAGPNPMFRPGASITVHTSRLENDPLSIVPEVREVIRAWGGAEMAAAVDVRSRATGYSSIHVVLHSTALRWDQDQKGMPVEFQLRSGLEEFWGQLDHQLRYEFKRGKVGGNTWEKHLNIVKAQFDAMIQYVDLIKELEQASVRGPGHAGEVAAADVGEPTPSSRSFSSAERQLKNLAALPSSVLIQVEQAFELWDQAEASRQFGGDPSLFQRAADAFKPLEDGYEAADRDAALSERLSYIARMERAFMLYSNAEDDNLQTAKGIYEGILAGNPDDAFALLRLGQIQIVQDQMDTAILSLDKSIYSAKKLLREHPNPELESAFDFARLTRALARFRKFENAELAPDVRRHEIELAIASSLEVLRDHTAPDKRRKPLNNLAYYAWEERNYARMTGTEPTVAREEYAAWCRELVGILQEAAATRRPQSFREADTLARIFLDEGDVAQARVAAELVCVQLERAAVERGEDGGTLVELRFNTRWFNKVFIKLMNEDERDALTFCRDTLLRHEP